MAESEPEQGNGVTASTTFGSISISGRDVVASVLIIALIALTVWEHYGRQGEHHDLERELATVAINQRANIDRGIQNAIEIALIKGALRTLAELHCLTLPADPKIAVEARSLCRSLVKEY